MNLKLIDMKRFLLLPAILLLILAGCSSSRNAVSRSGNDTVYDGYSHVPNDANTHSISTLDAERNKNRVYKSIYDMLIGEVAGVRVEMTGSDSANIYIRGRNSINGSSQPLFIVDGSEVNDISYLNPNDVERIDVLKDSSASMYGVRGANGVIVITTKHGR